MLKASVQSVIHGKLAMFDILQLQRLLQMLHIPQKQIMNPIGLPLRRLLKLKKAHQQMVRR